MDFHQRGNRRPRRSRRLRARSQRTHRARLQPEGFTSRQLNEQIIENATVILVAEKVHADWIVREWPQHHAKIKLLKQVARIREVCAPRRAALLPLFARCLPASIATSWKIPTAAAPQQQRSQWMR